MPFTGSDIIKVCIRWNVVFHLLTNLYNRSCQSSLYSSFVDGLLTRISPHSFAIILPPVGVFLERGCGADLLINIVLVRAPFWIAAFCLTQTTLLDLLGIHVCLLLLCSLPRLIPFTARASFTHSISS